MHAIDAPYLPYTQTDARSLKEQMLATLFDSIIVLIAARCYISSVHRYIL